MQALAWALLCIAGIGDDSRHRKIGRAGQGAGDTARAAVGWKMFSIEETRLADPTARLKVSSSSYRTIGSAYTRAPPPAGVLELLTGLVLAVLQRNESRL